MYAQKKGKVKEPTQGLSYSCPQTLCSACWQMLQKTALGFL